MFLARLENQCWAKTWLGSYLKIRAGPKLGLGPPTRCGDSGTSPGMRSLGSCRHYLLSFLETHKISSGQRGRHYFGNFPEMRRKTCRKKFRNGAQKKVPESAGLVGGPKPSFGPALIFKSGPKHPKWSEMGPESSVWPENRSP